MAKRTNKKTTKPVRPQLGDGVEILNAGSVLEDPITSTLETNYMPYAMSVIVSRALPEIDGFKPAHRKLLYTMYKMGLLTGARTKSANIVGATMKLGLAWDLSDTFNGLMMIPNLIGVLVLSGTVVDITRNYFDRRVKGKDIEPMWSAFLEYQKQEEAEAAAEEAELEKAANE